MAKKEHTIALKADPGDPEDFDVIEEALEIGLDPDVLAHFKATGRGWQGRINEALRKAMG